jgi:hypothetical protein
VILKTVRVQNFKSIEDCGTYSVNQVTCLVGKNESGKSALLQALYKLNPVVPEHAKIDGLQNYPRRRWSDYKARLASDPNATDPMLTTTWELEDDEHAALGQLVGSDALTGRQVHVSKGYDNAMAWVFPIDHKRLVAGLLEGADLHSEERQPLKDAPNVGGVIKALEGKAEKSARETAFLAALVAKFPEKTATAAGTKLLGSKLPKFVYFDSYYRMRGQIAVEAVKAKQASKTLDDRDRVFLALLSLARTDMAALEAMTQFEPLKAELEAVSNHLTDEIFNYWSQNKNLEVEFLAGPANPGDLPPFNQGVVFRTRIKNTRHRATVPFDDRSAGFVWFFSFLVWFSQVKAEYGASLVILLDEPGLSLHGRAQGDLLRYINERLAPSYRVLYTTHSPFMIDPDGLLSVRTVEDVLGPKGEILGTKVGDDIWSTDPDTIFPLLGVLGVDATQTLFVGKHNLLVEGPADVMYIHWARNELRSRKRTALDIRWTVVPTGGIGNISSFVSLFSGRSLDIATLTDFKSGGKSRVRDLRVSKLLESGRVFSAEKYAGQKEADIEDVLGRQFYVELVNRCYALPEGQRLPTQKPAGAPERVVNEVEAHFTTLPPDAPHFDHYGPAEYLVEHWGELRSALPHSEAALTRFEQFFTDVNKLLP